MTKRVIIIAYLLLGSFTSGICQAPLAEYVKEPIVRIETPGNEFGTGLFISRDDKKTVLITNRHVIEDKETGQIWDSVFVRHNEVSQKGRITAKPERTTIRLKSDRRNYYVIPQDDNIDLVGIPVTLWKLNDTTYIDNRASNITNKAFELNVLVSRDEIVNLNIKDGKSVFTLGYSFQAHQGPQYLITRYGHIGLFTQEPITMKIGNNLITSEWIIIDIITRGGDSGGPIFIVDKGKARIIGMTQATSKDFEIGIGIPSYFIIDLVEKTKTIF